MKKLLADIAPDSLLNDVIVPMGRAYLSGSQRASFAEIQKPPPQSVKPQFAQVEGLPAGYRSQAFEDDYSFFGRMSSLRESIDFGEPERDFDNMGGLSSAWNNFEFPK